MRDASGEVDAAAGADAASIDAQDSRRESFGSPERLAPGLGHIPVSVQIVLGSVTMTVAELSRIAPDSVIRLDRRLGEPVDILVNGQFIGRGEIIVIEEGDPCFAITITQIGDAGAGLDLTVQNGERRAGGDRRKLTGAQKAAVLLIVLGHESARLLKYLEPDAVKQIARAAATLGPIDRGSLERLIEDFAEEFSDGPSVVGTLAEAEKLAASSTPPRDLTEIMAGEPAAPAIDVWEKLDGAKDETILELIRSERAQVSATVLSKIDPERAARILSALAREERREILARLLGMRAIAPGVMSLIESVVGEFLATATTDAGAEAAPKLVAGIVNRMDPAEIDQVVEDLSETSPEAARGVRAHIFKFDDIICLTASFRSVLFDQVPTERVILALKGADPAVRDAVLGSLGARARRMVESELSSGEPSVARDVAAARRFIADLALRLAAAGTIELSSPAAAEASN